MKSFLTLVLFLVPAIVCSPGDKDYEYSKCLSSCIADTCPNYTQSLMLNLFLWTCPDNCKYECMRTIVLKRQAKNLGIYQYYGKWPFVRVLGMQEIASVLFSIGNMLAHYKGYQLLKSDRFFFMSFLYKINYYINMNTWFWSALYHCRDLPILEKLDYFGAALTLLFGVYYSLIRVFKVTSRKRQMLLGVPFALTYSLHVLKLSNHFDYGYNMKACLAIGMMFHLIWIIWFLSPSSKIASMSILHNNGFNPIMQRRPYAKLAMYFVVGALLGSSLEILDFPPILDLIDAHSLWHAATIPLIALWYKFLHLDALEETKQMTRN